MHEVMTLQLGQRANFTATHFWNIQVGPNNTGVPSAHAARNHTSLMMRKQSPSSNTMSTSGLAKELMVQTHTLLGP